MSDTFVRTTHQSYGNRIVTSCKQMATAPIWLIIGIWLLVWNEGNSIRQHKALEEGLAVVVDLFQDTESVNSELEGQLIHFSGQAETDSQVQDPIFGIAPTGALKLYRKVEMFQWVEHEHSETTKNTGGSTDTTTTYTYTKEWKDTLVASQNFRGEIDGHVNPTEMRFGSQTFVADNIHVGAFSLNTEVITKISWFRDYQEPLSTDTILEESTQQEATVSNNMYYFGNSPGTPKVGDTRVKFQVVNSQVISVVAKQTGGGLSTYTASSGGTVLLVESGYHDPQEMFQHANQALVIQTWFFRLFGWLLVYVFFQQIMQPLSVCADVIPFIGDLVEVGNSCLSGILSFMVSLVTIAIAWFAYRPVFSAVLFGTVLVGIILLKWQRQGRSGRTTHAARSYELPTGQFKDNQEDDDDDDLEEPGFSDHA